MTTHSVAPIVVLGFCLALGAGCSFDANSLRARNAQSGDAGLTWPEAGERRDGAGQPGLGDDANPGNKGDLVTTGLDGNRLGDSSPVRDAYSSTEADTREPDSALAVGLPDAEELRDRGVVQDDATIFDPLDASPSNEDARPAIDAGADVPGISDGARTVGVDVAGDTSNPADAAGPAPDAQTNPPDTGAVDAAVDTRPTIDPDLVLWYPFDESGGTIAYDSAQFGGVARNATLITTFGGTASFSVDRIVGTRALTLVPVVPGMPGYNAGAYAALPALNTLAPEAITIAVWVKLAVAGPAQAWERIYDFGDSSTAPCWFNLVARNSVAPFGPVFGISNTGHGTADQKLSASKELKANTWYHIAVVLPAGTPFTGTMYLDGAVAATNSAMTVHLSDIGATVNNWIGRSQFAADPYFNGTLDDLRVYRRALTQDEILLLMQVR